MPVVHLATCAKFPHGDPDDGALLLAACARAGIDASWQVWDDPAVAWAGSDLVIVRATWDYAARVTEFLHWADTVPTLANPARVLRWSADKRYLAELHRAGVPIVETQWVAPGQPAVLPDVGDYVVKPSVGAGSVGTARFRAGDPESAPAARAHIEALHSAGRTAMIQPYLAEVDAAGETALVYLGGAFSHAIGKGAMLREPVVNPLDGAALYVREEISARIPTDAEHALADRVLAAAPGDDLLYARVDLLPGADGPVLTELELLEPSLFLALDPGAPDRFAAAIAARLEQRPVHGS